MQVHLLLLFFTIYYNHYFLDLFQEVCVCCFHFDTKSRQTEMNNVKGDIFKSNNVKVYNIFTL